jgi:hypothetical protein
MVTNKQLNVIVEREISRVGLDPVTADKVRQWAGRWSDAFTRGREYSVASVTTMTRNAVNHHAGAR